MRRPLRIPTTLALALLLPSAASLGATFLAEGYALRTWQSDDGLPQNAVTSILQTRDGYLWIGTFGGLARFDGEHFTVFDSVNTPAMLDDRVVSLFEDADGALHIGHETGVVTCYRDGVFADVSPPAHPDGVAQIGSDETGRLWAVRDGGTIFSLHDGAEIPPFVPPRVPMEISWSRHPDGHLWIAENGVAARLEGGRIVPLQFDPPSPPGFVQSLAASAAGGVWVLGSDQIRRWQDGAWVENRGTHPWLRGAISSCIELRDGTLAVGTVSSGLYLVFSDDRAPVHLDTDDGLPQNWVRRLFEDRERTLWLGAGSRGLVAIHPTPISVLAPPDQWQGWTVLSVAASQDNGLWVGTEGVGLYHHAGDGWTHYEAAEGLDNTFIWSVLESDEGVAWAGTWTEGPYRLRDGKFVLPAAIEPGLGPIRALAWDSDRQGLLVGNRDGLLRLRDGQAAWLFRSPDNAPVNVCAIEPMGRETIWFGQAHGGLKRYDRGVVSEFTMRDGLGSNAVQCLLAQDGETLWVGTTGGLSRVKGDQIVNLTTSQGLIDDLICHVLDDGRGHLWLSTHRGIQRVATDDLNRCADGLVSEVSGLIYNRHSGLPTNEFSSGLQAAACQSTDGRLWFTSSKGLICVDPDRIQRNTTPPPVILESFRVDGESLPLGMTGEAPRLRPDQQRLEFEFAGLSFVAPGNVLFKYRLDGLDRDWVDAGSNRAASYSHLPAGKYRFRVIACNNDGTWNTEGASVSFSVAPFFWETWWFVATITLLTLSTVAYAVRSITRRRMQVRMEQMARQHAIERERARIARDIHDDVGASLARISMLSQPAQRDLSEHERTATLLSRIYSTSREMTQALDEIVWAVDPRHDTLDSLVSYMGKFAQDYLSAANIRCRLDLPIDLPAWRITADLRHNLFLAFKEAINNVLKHAEASEVHVLLDLRADSFVLTIKDDGRGCDAPGTSPANAGRANPGNGLPNMRKRLANIGGHCEFSTTEGAGTTVSFHVRVAPHGGVRSHPSMPDMDQPPRRPSA